MSKKTTGTLLEKWAFVLVHNHHLYHVLNRYKASGTNVVEHLYRARYLVQCLTFVPGGASARYKCVSPPSTSFPSLFYFFFISFLSLISFSSHLMSSDPDSKLKNYINCHSKFTVILISNHKIQNNSSITISMNLTIIHHISYKLQSHAIMHPHNLTRPQMDRKITQILFKKIKKIVTGPHYAAPVHATT
jgi:hypothetical protein